MRTGRAALLMIAGLLGGVASCLIGPDERLSCGDAYVSDAEECDPADPERAYLDACRAKGFSRDAECDPESCRILDEAKDCNMCGDGIAVFADGEQCDGEDLRGETCPSGQDDLRCTADCRLDYDDCPLECGDGKVTDNEECDTAAGCNDDLDCGNGTFCNGSWCVRLAEDGEAIDTCSDLGQTLVSGKEQFSAGEIPEGLLGCVEVEGTCQLSRAECTFCGDGVLDDALVIKPSASQEDEITVGPEFCDGEEIADEDLAVWCAPLCNDPDDRRTRCNFECKDDCSDFDNGILEDPDFLDPNFDHGCCLMKGEPCLIGEDLKCCDAANQGSVSLGTCKPGANLQTVCH